MLRTYITSDGQRKNWDGAKASLAREDHNGYFVQMSSNGLFVQQVWENIITGGDKGKVWRPVNENNYATKLAGFINSIATGRSEETVATATATREQIQGAEAPTVADVAFVALARTPRAALVRRQPWVAASTSTFRFCPRHVSNSRARQRRARASAPTRSKRRAALA